MESNFQESKDYKDELKKVFNNTVRAIKDRVLSNDFLNKLENFDNELRMQPPLARYKFGEGV